jgi:hypothetical protein
MKTIEEDTPLIPSIIAENVVAEVGDLIHYLNPTDPAGARLVRRAEHLYQVNPEFAKKLRRRGNGGRDTLYAFMRHWLAAYLLDAGCARDLIDPDWANGQPKRP